jgi:hypothetical protein
VGVRSAFASDYAGGVGRDISNNVRESFSVRPWAVGVTGTVVPGAAVPINTQLEFEIDLSQVNVADYIQQGIAAGEIFFTVSAMHAASLEGPLTAPSFYLDAGGQSLGPTATLLMEFTTGLAGDFDGNGILDAADIDLLSAEVRASANNSRFDLTADNRVNNDDRIYWINSLRRTYLGDANLDGEFNSADFVSVFVAGQYEDAVPGNSTWSTGDWDGDGEFGSRDFVVAFQEGAYENGPRPAANSVPEAYGLGTLGLWVGWFMRSFRRRTTH